MTLPAGASIDILDNPQADAQYGALINIAPFDVEENSEVPADFVVSIDDMKTAQAQLVVPNILDAMIEAEASDLTEEQALALDKSDSENNSYFLQEARRGRAGGGRHAGRGGRRGGGMTYCLMNVEIRAKNMGICPYKISEGYARRSLPGFVEKCGMVRTAYSDSLPIGSICVSEGTGRHMCGGAKCGDAKMKVGAGSWYNGVGSGYSSEHAIGFLYGCVAPGGSRVTQVSANDSGEDSGKKSSSTGRHKSNSSGRAHRRHRR